MDDQLRKLRELLSMQYGLETEVEFLKGLNCIVRLNAPKLDENGDPQCVAAFHLYWLPKEARFYLQDKRYSTYAPLRAKVIEFLRNMPELV